MAGQKKVKVGYPVEIANCNSNKKVVNNLEEHLDHALETPKRRTITRFAQLVLARYPISEYISEESKIFHSIYVNVQRWGITYFYPSVNDTPALVQWALDLISSEYVRLENNKQQAQQNIKNTSQGGTGRTR